MDNDHQNDHDAPPGLIHAFKQLRTKTVDVPRSVDDAVLGAARRRLGKPSRTVSPHFGWWAGVRGWSHWIKVPALAGACLLLALLARPYLQPDSTRFAREDVNRDGQVDILDAFELARDVQSGAAPPAALDLNGDGVVSRLDADIIAAEAVSLEKKGGRS